MPVFNAYSTEMAWSPVYGAYECMVNAVCFWLDVNGIDRRNIEKVNWDFLVNVNSGLFGGSMSLQSLWETLRYFTGVEILEIMPEKIPSGELVIVPFNARELPYIPEYFNCFDQLHFVPTHWNPAGDITLYDPYYQVSLSISEDVFKASQERYDRRIIRLVNTSSRIITAPVWTKPNVLYRNLHQVYETVHESLLILFGRLCELGPDMMHNMVFRRTFSCLRGMSLARTRHFEAMGSKADAQEYKGEVLRAWIGVEKSCMQMTFDVSFAWPRLKMALERALETEMAYLEQWKDGEYGSM